MEEYNAVFDGSYSLQKLKEAWLPSIFSLAIFAFNFVWAMHFTVFITAAFWNSLSSLPSTTL